MQLNWQKPWVRAASTFLVLALMVVIFLFSAQGRASEQTSEPFANIFISTFHSDYADLPVSERIDIRNIAQTVARKGAHVLEYLLLGFLLRVCLESWFGAPDKNPGKRRKKFWLFALLAWLGGTGYAALDEIHQTMVDGRTGRPLDVLIDSSGVLTGTLITLLALWFFLYRRKNAD